MPTAPSSEPDVTVPMPAWLPTAVLGSLGLYCGFTVLSGTLSNYTNPEFGWLVLVAAVLFLILAVGSGWAYWTQRQPAAKLCAAGGVSAALPPTADAPEHHHHGPRWPTLAVVAVPLLLGLLVPPRPLGASAIPQSITSGTSGAVRGSLAGRTNSPSVGSSSEELTPDKWTIWEWQRAAQSGRYTQAYLSGWPVNVIGFVARSPNLPAHSFVVARWVMIHCAADARGVGLLVQDFPADDLATDTWVAVHGLMEANKVGDNLQLTIRATAIDPHVGEPRNPYLLPFNPW